jgi:predicted metal-dependent phosphoesterase TrpH
MTDHYPQDINVDLHMHSTASDGRLAPAALMARAHANGVQVVALTDHDTLLGQDEAQQAASDLGIHYVPGVEISVTWAGETIHIVGLQVDPAHAGLNQGLAAIQSGRRQRARAMVDGLMAEGLPDLFEAAQAYAQNKDLIGRTHVARALVAHGSCETMDEVFQRYLVPGKPGYVAHQWAGLTEAVGWIRASGGIAVIAHPARYRLNALTHWALLQEFKALGGQALEVVTGSHTVQEARRYQRIALEHGFLASRGSDFHGPDESRYDVGCVPPLPDATRPVWHGWAHW